MNGSSNQSTVYTDDFYKNRNTATRHAASTVLSIVQTAIPSITSAADLGCGVGTWLSVLKERGTERIRGFDGNWVGRELLEIPLDCFEEHDLRRELRPSDRYSLAISLEVAEHLPADCAFTIVDSLVNLSDFVLFSAAIPWQGGVNHVNERWQDYWAKLFSDRGYVPLDIIRHRIWGDDAISIPYRQNIILYVKSDRLPCIRIPFHVADIASLPLVHPRLFEVANSKSVMRSLRDLRECIAAKVRRKK